MLLAAGRRFLILFAVVGGASALVSIVFGLLLGASIRRAVSLTFYVVGSFLLVAGFFVGNRGRARAESDQTGYGGPLGGLAARKIRVATRDEERETVSAAAIFISLGVALLLVGVVVDAREQLL
jgi:hypothetical protein